MHGANSYEPQSAVVAVANVRNSIGYAAEVSVELERVADRIGLTRSPGPILSVADIANRLISLRLDPAQHPLPGDTRWALLIAGIRASARRVDVRPPLRALYGAWFFAIALAPRPPGAEARRLVPLPGPPPRFERAARPAPPRLRPAVRILLVTPMPPQADAHGAIPLVLHAQLAGLLARGHEVTLVTAATGEPGEAAALERLRGDGIDLHVAVRSTGAEGRWRRRSALAGSWLRGDRPWRTVWFAVAGMQQTLDRLTAEREFDVVAFEDNATGSYDVPPQAPARVDRARGATRPPAGPSTRCAGFLARLGLLRARLAPLAGVRAERLVSRRRHPGVRRARSRRHRVACPTAPRASSCQPVRHRASGGARCRCRGARNDPLRRQLHASPERRRCTLARRAAVAGAPRARHRGKTPPRGRRPCRPRFARSRPGTSSFDRMHRESRTSLHGRQSLSRRSGRAAACA